MIFATGLKISDFDETGLACPDTNAIPRRDLGDGFDVGDEGRIGWIDLARRCAATEGLDPALEFRQFVRRCEQDQRAVLVARKHCQADSRPLVLHLRPAQLDSQDQSGVDGIRASARTLDRYGVVEFVGKLAAVSTRIAGRWWSPAAGFPPGKSLRQPEQLQMIVPRHWTAIRLPSCASCDVADGAHRPRRS